MAATKTLLPHDCTEEALTALSDADLLHDVDEILMEIERLEPTAAAEMLWCLLTELFERHIPHAALEQTLRFHREHDHQVRSRRGGERRTVRNEATGCAPGAARRHARRPALARRGRPLPEGALWSTLPARSHAGARGRLPRAAADCWAVLRGPSRAAARLKSPEQGLPGLRAPSLRPSGRARARRAGRPDRAYQPRLWIRKVPDVSRGRTRDPLNGSGGG